MVTRKFTTNVEIGKHMKIPVDDRSGKQLPNLEKVLNTIKEHFQNNFNDNSHESIESTPHIFHNKIINEEVNRI